MKRDREWEGKEKESGVVEGVDKVTREEVEKGRGKETERGRGKWKRNGYEMKGDRDGAIKNEWWTWWTKGIN